MRLIIQESQQNINVLVSEEGGAAGKVVRRWSRDGNSKLVL
jgi:hypothetical protein